MNILKATGGMAATIAMLGLAVPAEAQRHRGGGDRGHGRGGHHRGGDRIDAGDVILGAILLGGILAIGDSAKKRRERAEAADADYDTGADVSVYDGTYDTDSATDRCASAAETMAQSYARLTRVTAISDTIWNGSSWVVKGKVELAESYTDSARRTRNFRCALRAGSDPQISFEGL